MAFIEPRRRPYAAPRLVVYGTLQDLTLSATTVQSHKNDSVQGQTNLKT